MRFKSNLVTVPCFLIYNSLFSLNCDLLNNFLFLAFNFMLFMILLSVGLIASLGDLTSPSSMPP